MTAENATYVADLAPLKPSGSDPADGKRYGDDHLRLIKGVLQRSFPGLKAPVIFGDLSGGSGNYSLNPTPGPAAYAEKMTLIFTVPEQNPGPSTVNIASLGSRSLINADGSQLLLGQLSPAGVHIAVYKGGSFVLVSGNTASQAQNDVLKVGLPKTDFRLIFVSPTQLALLPQRQGTIPLIFNGVPRVFQSFGTVIYSLSTNLAANSTYGIYAFWDSVAGAIKLAPFLVSGAVPSFEPSLGFKILAGNPQYHFMGLASTDGVGHFQLTPTTLGVISYYERRRILVEGILGADIVVPSSPLSTWLALGPQIRFLTFIDDAVTISIQSRTITTRSAFGVSDLFYLGAGVDSIVSPYVYTAWADIVSDSGPIYRTYTANRHVVLAEGFHAVNLLGQKVPSSTTVTIAAGDPVLSALVVG